MKKKAILYSILPLFSILLSISFFSCSNDDKTKEETVLKAGISDAASSKDLIDINIDYEAIQRKVVVKLNEQSDEKINVTIDADQKYVNTYNEKHGTSLTMFPKNNVVFDNGGKTEIAAGKKASDMLTFTIDKGTVKDGVYLLPIAVTGINPQIEILLPVVYYKITVSTYVPTGSLTDASAAAVQDIDLMLEFNDPLERKLSFVLTQQSKAAINFTIAADDKYVAIYNKANGTSFSMFPKGQISLSNEGAASIKEGQKESQTLTLAINKGEVKDGNYLLPIAITSTTENIEFTRDVLYYKITVKKFVGKASGIVSICYVEVNDANPLNAGSYSLAKSKLPLFDIVNLFAANINYDVASKKPTLHFNENVTAVLKNRNKYIKPLQDKGIKVCLTVLGNWGGIGFSNMTDEQIAHFAQLCKDAVDTYQLDGIDFDDEYSNYGENGLPSRNTTSYSKMLIEMRRLMPDKLITVYYISSDRGTGANMDTLEGMSKPINGVKVGEVVDYMYWPFYGAFHNLIGTSACPAGLKKEQWGPAPLWVNNNNPNADTAKEYAQKIVNEGFGVNLVYDLRTGDHASYFSGVTNVLYKENTVKTGASYGKDW